jgi:hypothetical protein
MTRNRNTTGSIGFTLEDFDYLGDCRGVEFSISYSASPYHRAVPYLRNGDPGYPAEGGEIDDVAFTVK